MFCDYLEAFIQFYPRESNLVEIKSKTKGYIRKIEDQFQEEKKIIEKILTKAEKEKENNKSQQKFPENNMRWQGGGFDDSNGNSDSQEKRLIGLEKEVKDKTVEIIRFNAKKNEEALPDGWEREIREHRFSKSNIEQATKDMEEIEILRNKRLDNIKKHSVQQNYYPGYKNRNYHNYNSIPRKNNTGFLVVGGIIAFLTLIGLAALIKKIIS